MYFSLFKFARLYFYRITAHYFLVEIFLEPYFSDLIVWKYLLKAYTYVIYTYVVTLDQAQIVMGCVQVVKVTSGKML